MSEATSPVETKPALRLWIEFFDDLQNIRGRSLNTVMAYRRDLEIWEDYRRTHSDVLGFFSYMKDRGLSTRSQARVISSLRTYFRFLESQGISSPELRELRPPKVKAGLPKSLTPAEFQLLYDAAESENTARTARNRMTLLLLYGLGCRVSELIALNLSDFNETDQWLSIFGKGGKERAVPLTKNLAAELRAYLVGARPQLVKDATDAILSTIAVVVLRVSMFGDGWRPGRQKLASRSQSTRIVFAMAVQQPFWNRVQICDRFKFFFFLMIRRPPRSTRQLRAERWWRQCRSIIRCPVWNLAQSTSLNSQISLPQTLRFACA